MNCAEAHGHPHRPESEQFRPLDPAGATLASGNSPKLEAVLRPNWFVGLVVPEQAGLAQLLVDLPAGVRAFEAADLHLTVAFLGPCEQEQALRAWRAIAPLHHPPLNVTTAGWRLMGPAKKPSAYALTLGPDPQQPAGQTSQLTSDLIERWRQPALAAAGLPPERRQALPHITLARPRRRGLPELQIAMEAWLQQAPGAGREVVLSDIALYTWADDRQRRLFRIQARRPLAGLPDGDTQGQEEAKASESQVRSGALMSMRGNTEQSPSPQGRHTP